MSIGLPGAAVVSLAALAALVGAELGARFWIRRFSQCYVFPPGLRIDVEVDAEAFPELDRRARFEVNADGERGGEVRAGEQGLYRILVAGGSPVENFLLDEPVSWPGALERMLGTPGNLRALGARRVHVGSIGRSGIASQELDLILRRVFPQYRHLSAVLIMVGGNDAFQWLADGAPARMEPSPIPLSRVFQCHPEEPLSWRPRRSGVVRVLGRLRRVWLRPRETRERAGSWTTWARAMRAGATETRTTTADPGVMLDQFEHHFRQLLLAAKDHADRVLVLRQPWFEKDYTPEELGHLWHGGLGEAWKEDITAYYSLEVLNRLMGLVDARAVKIAGELGVEQVDLRAALEPSLMNYCDYVHFTPAGSATVARTVAETLVKPPSRRDLRTAE